MIAEFAAAKVNLSLHVTGQRPDGYHLLDSLVVFADVGDRVSVAPAPKLGLTLAGPAAEGLRTEADNLVLRAARAFGVNAGAAITLEKHLPVASGIGGGSADAAAALRALARFWDLPLPDAAAVLRLGADVPVCLQGRPVRMQGVGEIITPLPALPEGWLLLVNPGVGVSTPAVFRALPRKDNPPMSAALPPFADLAALAEWLAAQRNDLEPPAMALQPVIAQVKAALQAQPGCRIARMSGSGATCFGLFAAKAEAEQAAAALRQANPGWWVQAGAMLS
ncbi:MAG: 4-(cytidine 5'-diphospho)-2-C-methyl-D-erythritol kinase [Rhodobacteraceae bacterium GWE1_64_9]|nr:MAG: 4-(cytidine 5'-diphospho)-2-C-methyl-D-erythritol kinase [Rhodobacteraceae bacterium GWE1_64_9]OHC50030.1 MAG: 4-(cytidine 5'-diphospho)-2-C-methyl-D-erythritol kinase [Rhodobacteraceae bacterium GWF1_65_7]HBD90324.1 4-(cytidine 5'-diphospho)-2-C-methyl-D-erythritol kinase [Gemmobacter sp.]HBU13571.1 4-(cytidine 5'-diphospho)-2-C-methyl-D-erythritol kinase [Gemmobacter sp.]